MKPQYVYIIVAAVVGLLLLYVFSPVQAGRIFPFLLVLLCPLGMLFMHGGMGHGGCHGKGHNHEHGKEKE